MSGFLSLSLCLPLSLPLSRQQLIRGRCDISVLILPSFYLSLRIVLSLSTFIARTDTGDCKFHQGVFSEPQSLPLLDSKRRCVNTCLPLSLLCWRRFGVDGCSPTCFFVVCRCQFFFEKVAQGCGTRATAVKYLSLSPVNLY